MFPKGLEKNAYYSGCAHCFDSSRLSLEKPKVHRQVLYLRNESELHEFLGLNLPGARISQGLRDSFSLQARLGSLRSAYECIKAFPETDFFLLFIKQGQPRNRKAAAPTKTLERC
jgi:hypothetical protein